jgi:hypothetical protein
MRLPLDTLKLLFSNIDISLTANQIEAKYANSGKGRPHYPVRSMLLSLMFMRFEAVPSLRKLCRKLERRRYAREICEFTGDNLQSTTRSASSSLAQVQARLKAYSPSSEIKRSNGHS